MHTSPPGGTLDPSTYQRPLRTLRPEDNQIEALFSRAGSSGASTRDHEHNNNCLLAFRIDKLFFRVAHCIEALEPGETLGPNPLGVRSTCRIFQSGV
jgi:hypothetical protein